MTALLVDPSRNAAFSTRSWYLTHLSWVAKQTCLSRLFANLFSAETATSRSLACKLVRAKRRTGTCAFVRSEVGLLVGPALCSFAAMVNLVDLTRKGVNLDKNRKGEACAGQSRHHGLDGVRTEHKHFSLDGESERSSFSWARAMWSCGLVLDWKGPAKGSNMVGSFLGRGSWHEDKGPSGSSDR